MTAGNPALYQTHRCALFGVSEGDLKRRPYTHIVATFHLDFPLAGLAVGESVDAKVIAGFRDQKSADEVFNLYGPSYLVGDRLNRSDICRIA